MHSSFVLTPLLASMAVANPLFKRYLTTHVEYFTVWTTVTVDGAAPTGVTDGQGSGSGSDSGYGYDSEYGYDSDYSSPSMSSETPLSTAAPVMSSEAPVISSATPVSSEMPVSSEAPMFYEPSASPVGSPVSNAPSGGGSYSEYILAQHNIHRANHTDTGPLTWSNKLAATARKIAESCYYAHDTNMDASSYDGGYGQNIAAGATPEGMRSMISDYFYNSEAPYYEGLYGQSNVAFDTRWGHFTQMVWRNTREVGCYTHQCSALGNTRGNVRPYFSVCNFYPPGNMQGAYDNVGERLGNPTVAIDPGNSS